MMRFASTLLVSLCLTFAAAPARAGQVRINVNGMSFVSSTASLNLGDHAVWVWTAGSHTVTSGTDGSTGGSGTFNTGGGFLGISNARFSWKSTQAGVLDYYCVPHFSSGMTATLNVAASGVSVSDFRITEVQFNLPGGQDLIEIANLGDAAGNFGRYRFAIGGTTVEVPLNDIVVAPGARVVIHANASGTNTLTDFYLPTLGDLPETGSLALYVPNTVVSAVTAASQMIDFVQWGAGGQANEATAVTALLWQAGEAITGVDAGHSIEFCGSGGEYGFGEWSEVTVPNVGGAGNCATPTVRSTWGRLKTLYR
jgi:plastocyanin